MVLCIQVQFVKGECSNRKQGGKSLFNLKHTLETTAYFVEQCIKGCDG